MIARKMGAIACHIDCRKSWGRKLVRIYIGKF